MALMITGVGSAFVLFADEHWLEEVFS